MILRNGWYTENHPIGLSQALEHGAIVGAVGEDRFSSAACADYAKAAAKVLTADDQAGKVYELAGDQAYTLAEFAAELSPQAGKPINVSTCLRPTTRACCWMLAGPNRWPMRWRARTSPRARTLFNDGHALSALLGRPPTPMRDTIAGALRT